MIRRGIIFVHVRDVSNVSHRKPFPTHATSLNLFVSAVKIDAITWTARDIVTRVFDV